MRRPDGYYIKNLNPYQKLMPHLMTKRSDSMNMCNIQLRCENIEKFIKEQSELGNNYTYLHVVLASIVRLFAKRPCLNRFVIKGRIYQHYDITIAMAVKKRLRDDVEDTTIKFHFTGSESLDEIKEKVDSTINANIGDTARNRVDNTAKVLSILPNPVLGAVVGLLKLLDRNNLMPASLIETIPFHNSVFVTFLKSIKGDALYHHCYDFGTTGIFFGIGKEKDMAVVECGQVKVARILEIGCVTDERFCDGLYFVNSLRTWKNLVRRPAQLLENYDLESEEHLINGVTSDERDQHKKEMARYNKIQAKKQAKLMNKQAKLDKKK